MADKTPRRESKTDGTGTVLLESASGMKTARKEEDEDEVSDEHVDESIQGLEHAESNAKKKKKGKPALKLSDLMIKSTMIGQATSPDEQADKIVEAFNADVKETCFTYNPAPGRAMHRVPKECFLMGHKNQVTELADPKGRRIALTFIVDPTVVIQTLGTVDKNAPYFGQYGKHVLNVPAGYYAKGFSKNHPVLYGEGPHVVLDSTFRFKQEDGFVSQLEPYIQHSTISILRIPSGKLAKVWVGSVPKILESRPDPYIYNDAQFRLVTRDDKIGDKVAAYFYNATERYIEHGSIKRIIPHTGECAITYNNGILDIRKPQKDGKPIIIDSSTHNFDGFISTALQTLLFPSDDTKAQVLKDNAKAGPDERNMKIFQTRDSLRVGVVIVVAFKITDPEVAITKLGKDGILPHIENIAFADMGKAIQANSAQEVLFSSQSRINQQEASVTIQDSVRKNLAKDLEEYGIELLRLNIETLKVLDEEIAKKLSGQSVTSAEYTTKQATLVKEYDIKTTEARLRAETENIAVQQRNQAIIADAQAKLDKAKREADALLIAAEAQRKASEFQGELFQKFPALYELEMAKIKAEAIKRATIYITPQDMGNFFNSPFMLFNSINKPNTPQQQQQQPQ